MRDIFRVKNKQGLGPIVNPGVVMSHLVDPIGRHYCGVTIRDLPNPPLGRRRLDAPLRYQLDPYVRSGGKRIRLCGACLSEYKKRIRTNKTF